MNCCIPFFERSSHIFFDEGTWTTKTEALPGLWQKFGPIPNAKSDVISQFHVEKFPTAFTFLTQTALQSNSKYFKEFLKRENTKCSQFKRKYMYQFSFLHLKSMQIFPI